MSSNPYIHHWVLRNVEKLFLLLCLLLKWRRISYKKFTFASPFWGVFTAFFFLFIFLYYFLISVLKVVVFQIQWNILSLHWFTFSCGKLCRKMVLGILFSFHLSCFRMRLTLCQISIFKKLTKPKQKPKKQPPKNQ